jgi:hypothetical protein
LRVLGVSGVEMAERWMKTSTLMGVKELMGEENV